VPANADPHWLRGGTYMVARRIRMLIEVWDRATYIVVVIVVAAVGMAATFLPARRILRIDAAASLRV